MVPMEKAKVKAQVVLGETWLTLDSLSKMGEGAIVELESLAGEPVDFVVSGKPVAKGEVVIIDENFGIRLTEVLPVRNSAKK